MRHNSLRDAIHEYAVEAGFNPRKEVRFLLPGRDSRPADVLIPHFAGGRDAALDVTVVNPCQVATVVGAAETPGHAIIFAHNRKVRGAEEACQAQGLAFLPLVVESFGGWGRWRETWCGAWPPPSPGRRVSPRTRPSATSGGGWRSSSSAPTPGSSPTLKWISFKLAIHAQEIKLIMRSLLLEH